VCANKPDGREIERKKFLHTSHKPGGSGRSTATIHREQRAEASMTLATAAEGVSHGQRRHDKYDRLVAVAQSLPRLKVAVAHPCDAASLGAVVEAVELGLIEPILVGPQAKIRTAAEALGKDVSQMRIVDAPHSQAAAEAAVDLVRSGQAEALMKGSLHTDELMGAVVRREGGLRTARRISHCFVMDVPTHDTALIITDAAVNIAPTLEDKVHIVQNAIDLARALRVDPVRVAILSAMETVNPKVPSTIEAAALCKMADRGQITGGILDGPLALDNAIDLGAAKIKKIQSPVAGQANVLVVPDLEAGNMLAKSLTFLADADAAGIVLGARVPIILTSRADSTVTRLASCAVASLVADAQRSRLAIPEV
jgi:phosphate acetyltransferase